MDTLTSRINAAAATLLHEVGDGFTMEQLAARAQVPRATLYRRIGSKQALLDRLYHALQLAHARPPDLHTRILVAARRVVAHAGLAGATMEQIAAEAGVGVATVYRHFGDKDALIRTFIAELSPRPIVRDLAEPTPDVVADLRAVATTLLPFLYEYRDILRLILTADATERAYIEHLRASSDRTLDQLEDYFAAQIAAGRLAVEATPQEVALAFLGLLLTFAVVGPAHYATALDDVDRIAALIAQVFTTGLQHDGGGT